MKKNLEYYFSLKYPIEIYEIPSDEGGGFSACIPQLGRNAFIADGDTMEEALKNLNIVKEENFKRMYDNDIPIIEPIDQEDEEFSGRFITRIPKELHRQIVQKAKKNGISLNQYVQFMLLKGIMSNSFEELSDLYYDKIKQVVSDMKNIEYIIEQKKGFDEYQPKLHLIDKNKKCENIFYIQRLAK